MASPAASSAARLMRYPELRRSMDLLARSLVAASWRWALKASMLLLMRRDIRLLLDDAVVRFGPEGNSLSPVDSVIGSAGENLRKFFRGDGGAAAQAAAPRSESW